MEIHDRVHFRHQRNNTVRIRIQRRILPDNKDELELDSVDPENELYHEFPLGGSHVLHNGILSSDI